MASEGWSGKEGRKRPPVGTRPLRCFGPLPDAKQSNVLLILITEMILIRSGAGATFASSEGGPPLRGGGD